jgi:hypothetical protein
MPRLPPVQIKRLRLRLDRNPIYTQYASSGTLEGVSRFMVADLLQASPDAPHDLLKSKLDRLISIAELAQDEKILSFLRALYKYFSEVLSQDKGSDHE